MSTSYDSTTLGYFFEDFKVGRRFRHPTPRTVGQGDAALYIALTGARQPVPSSAELARSLGYRDAPLDDVLVFNMAFGKTVPDISFNAIANLGYADARFLKPVYAGDTVRAESEVIGIRETSGGDSGVVYVRSTAFNQFAEPILTWVRWVLVRKQNCALPAPTPVVPELPAAVSPADVVVPNLRPDWAALRDATGSSRTWEQYQAGQWIEHPAGMTLDESDHTFATRLYQNSAKVHFDAKAMADTPHGRRLVYGGHVISVCRALAYDGLENVLGLVAINGGSHSAPTFAGDTLYALTQVREKWELPGRDDLGLLRLRLVGLKNVSSQGFHPDAEVEVGRKPALRPEVVLDLDYTVILPRLAAAV